MVSFVLRTLERAQTIYWLWENLINLWSMMKNWCNVLYWRSLCLGKWRRYNINYTVPIDSDGKLETQLFETPHQKYFNSLERAQIICYFVSFVWRWKTKLKSITAINCGLTRVFGVANSGSEFIFEGGDFTCETFAVLFEVASSLMISFNIRCLWSVLTMDTEFKGWSVFDADNSM